jgi:hypothetical protein
MKNIICYIKLNLFKISVYTLTLIISANSVWADGIDSLFRSDEIIKMELRSDFSTIQKERENNAEYHNSELIYYNAANEPVKLSVKVMVRGNFRLKPTNCNFPPLLLNFRKNEVKNTIFENQDKLKLVTPCQTEEDLIEEYTAYKMYNQVTDLSFKVRLVKILYFDTYLNKTVFEKYSFFLEDKEHVAERNNMLAKDRLATPFDMNEDNYIKLSMFQYLIGNKDWWVSSRKNIVIMESENSFEGLFAVPYDFDFSGLVNADYTKPMGDPDYPIDNRRVYKGICFTDDQFREVFEFFRQLRPEFESIINNQVLVSKSDRRQILRYINDFYIVIDNKYLVKQHILNACETRKDYNLTN